MSLLSTLETLISSDAGSDPLKKDINNAIMRGIRCFIFFSIEVFFYFANYIPEKYTEGGTDDGDRC